MPLAGLRLEDFSHVQEQGAPVTVTWLASHFPAPPLRAKHPNVRAQLHEEAAKEKARLPDRPLSSKALPNCPFKWSQLHSHQ